MSEDKKTSKPRIDWEACERDYRTGKFTLRELESKHGVSYAQISRKAKAEAWVKDLREVIKQATDSALLHEAVTKAQKDATETVSVAVDVNLSVIRGHRVLLGDLADDVREARVKLKEIGQTVSDIREAATYVQAVGNLAGATKTLIEQERKAFGLDEGDSASPFEEMLKSIGRSDK